MNEHNRCPECDSLNTETVHREWFRDSVELTRICNACPTEWVVEYGDPIVKDVEQYE